MSIDAMKMALEALTNPSQGYENHFAAITALRAAIEAAERQEPVECKYTRDVGMPEYRCVGKCQYTTPQPDISALLYEAHDYGQFADDFNQPLAKPIRKAIRDMLTRYTPPDEAQERKPATTAREAFWKAALGNNTKLANLAKAAIAEAEKSRPAQQTSYQEYKEYKRKRLEDAGFLKFPLRGAIPQPAPAGMVLVPVEPTEEMILAGLHHENMGDMEGRYKAMLAAAPKEMK